MTVYYQTSPQWPPWGQKVAVVERWPLVVVQLYYHLSHSTVAQTITRYNQLQKHLRHCTVFWLK